MARKPARTPGPRSPAQIEASRRNGAAGGRPRAPTPADPAFLEEGERVDPLDVQERMAQRLEVEVASLYAPGAKISARERRRELRAFARLLSPIVTKSRLRRAEKTVRGELEAISAQGKDPGVKRLRKKGDE